ncbi:hypothetical protein PAG51_21330 [Klebsiella pneumoniae]|uniref:hypothetical protein n=1 Tax=Klebsiella pneumoniae TaxID=573 RepID=UPI00188F60FE|nr:hypothetical protein [Klebsiella pneumoniae]MDR4657600.1 hypothetical protein [Klebsiella pneumoniae]MDZ0071373.1 hypothetical protein [Klebsiella pneumoniae]MDZ0082552.1 hypothetical protein [Klebsiella pneumoniae]MDZ0166898.1 hypothetical protein [Klebsiella pneumoniae]MDZ0174807.1 hypothetical protein [Klebsiella pneumoniae]
MNIETVNELIASLESAGELSIREQKFLKLAKAFKQLAAENVALKKFCKNAAFDADYEAELGMERGGFTDALNNIETPATDRIVAGIKADGVEEFSAHLRANDNGASVCKMIALGAEDFAKQLREGADK